MDDKRAFREAGKRVANESPQGTTKLTRLSLVDKAALCSSVVLLVLSVPQTGLFGPSWPVCQLPVCVGGQLSVQAWLAIIGVEFTLTGSVLLPRLPSTTISQSMTSRLMKKGASLDMLLHSLSSAAFLTQIRMGWRKVALARLTVTLVVLATTVLYKFSFVLVNRKDTLLVQAKQIG